MWNFFLYNSKFTFVLIMASIAIGLLSVKAIPKESSPEVKVPIATVSTFYLGAGSEDIEEKVTKVLENEIKSLSNIDTYTSVSTEGVSMITVQFEMDSDLEKNMQNLRNGIERSVSDLPADAKAPRVAQIDFADQAVVSIALSSASHPLQLYKIAEDLKDELQGINGVSSVDIQGGYKPEIQVLLEKEKLELYQIDSSFVAELLSKRSNALGGGVIESGGIKYQISLKSGLENISDLRKLKIITHTGETLNLEDIAKIISGYAPPQTISRISIDGQKSQNAVMLQVKKKTGGDVSKLGKDVDEFLTEYKKAYSDVNIVIPFSMSEEVSKDLNNLFWSGMQTTLIVFLILWFFIGFKEALIAGISIPLSFMLGISWLYFTGYTINFLSLFSLIIALGILVDSAIVITEGVHKNMQNGMEVFDACKRTLDEYSIPVISGVLTTIGAMVPMLFASGIIGEYIKNIPITITYVLVSSLLVTLCFLPVIIVAFFKKQSTVSKTFEDKLNFNSYQNLLKRIFHEKILQKYLYVFFIVGLCFALFLPISGILKIAMFPQGDSDVLYFNIENKLGSSLEITNEKVEKIEEIIMKDNRFKEYTLVVGAGFNADSFSPSSAGETHKAYFMIKLQEDRNFESMEVVNEYQKLFSSYSDVKIVVSQLADGPPSGAPITLKVKGKNIDQLEKITNDFSFALKKVEGVHSVKSSLEDSGQVFELELERENMAKTGVNISQVMTAIQSATVGIDSLDLSDSDNDLEVKLRVKTSDGNANLDDIGKANIDDILSIPIITQNGSVNLDAVLSLKLTKSPLSYLHEDGQRVAYVTAYIYEGFNTFEVIQNSIKSLDAIKLPAGYLYIFGGENEDMQESFNDMFRALIIGIFLIALILVLQFNSFKQTFFVLLTIPLALIGIFPGLVLVGLPLSFTGFIGVVALAGIVVNNAILLIDRINENVKNGMNNEDAIFESSLTRIRPIILTTLTTVAGMLPLTLSDKTWGPFGYSIIFGLLFATVLTLVFIPLLCFKYPQK